MYNSRTKIQQQELGNRSRVGWQEYYIILTYYLIRLQKYYIILTYQLIQLGQVRLPIASSLNPESQEIRTQEHNTSPSSTIFQGLQFRAPVLKSQDTCYPTGGINRKIIPTVMKTQEYWTRQGDTMTFLVDDVTPNTYVGDTTILGKSHASRDKNLGVSY